MGVGLHRPRFQRYDAIRDQEGNIESAEPEQCQNSCFMKDKKQEPWEVYASLDIRENIFMVPISFYLFKGVQDG